jgi:hypothetical protein
MMKRIIQFAAVLLLAACATPADVRTVQAPGTDVGKFRTFAFVQGDLKAAGAIADAKVRERLQYQIAIHLGSRGYTPAAPGQAADIGVHYVGRVEQAQNELMTGYPGLYEYRGGNVDLGGISSMDYRQGTLVIDLFDRAGKQLLWRATIAESFAASYTEDNWKKLDAALGRAFKDLPARR